MEYDIVINNGYVVFGNKNKAENINIGIVKDKIRKISKEFLQGKIVIDATNKIVSPGFIDPHSHSDASIFFNENMTSKIYQGVTTEINGNCGVGIFPIKENFYNECIQFIREHFILPNEDFRFSKNFSISDIRKKLEVEKFVTNQGYLIATGALRVSVAGFNTEELSDEKLKLMLEILKEELEKGALGVSFGLIYQPGNYMSKREIVEIMKVVASFDGIASFHMRNEGANIISSLKEIITYARISGCKTNVSHLKIMGKDNWYNSKTILELIEKANKDGLKLTYDQYPYNATSTTLMVLFPDDIFQGNIKEFMVQIDKLSLEDKNRILENIEKRGGAKKIMVSNCSILKEEFLGKTLFEIEKNLNLSTIETLLYIMKKTQGRVEAIYFSMVEEDIENFIKFPLGVIGSDGTSISNEKMDVFGNPHPRNFTTFPKFIEINRKKNYFSLEEMIYKITKKTADIYSIKGRGEIKIDNFADIVIFDYEDIQDTSTFIKPFTIPKGIEYVLVNGKIVVRRNKYIDIKNGIFI